MSNINVIKDRRRRLIDSDVQHNPQYLRERYIDDVGALLVKIAKLKANEAQFIEICSEQNARIENLHRLLKESNRSPQTT